MIDRLHQRGIGVILDWVPSHFATDGDALVRFDGTHLYEHADPRQGHHPDWGSAIFNYGRNEVRSFLLSSAMSWLERYHADGLRVDAVASMLYLDYSRQAGEWIPNAEGGRTNLEAIAFLRQMNDAIHDEYPDVLTIAEESTAWPGVTAPTAQGGLGFDLKWDMGWMHDTLSYLSHEPVHRSWHHNDLTFRAMYAHTEQFVLPLSHDEVVHGKGSLLGKQPGDLWQKFANLRVLYGLQWTTPGVPLMFMGGELAATREWDHESTLDWSLHDAPGHEGVRLWVAALNRLSVDLPALWRLDDRVEGFRWAVADDSRQSVVAFVRFGDVGDVPVLVVANLTPEVRHDYRIGVPERADGGSDAGGPWAEVLSSDAGEFGGAGIVAGAPVIATDDPAHGFDHSIAVTLAPLAVQVFTPV
jgi:1,4-alpha-glucan branching enzyme